MGTWYLYKSDGTTEITSTTEENLVYTFGSNTDGISKTYKVKYVDDSECSKEITIAQKGCCTFTVYSDAEGASVSWHNGAGTVYGSGTITDGKAEITLEGITTVYVTLTKEGVEFENDGTGTTNCGGEITINKKEDAPVYFKLMNYDNEIVKLTRGNSEIIGENIPDGSTTLLPVTDNIVYKVFINNSDQYGSFGFTTSDTDAYIYIDVYPYRGLGLEDSEALWDTSSTPHKQFGLKTPDEKYSQEYIKCVTDLICSTQFIKASYHEDPNHNPGATFDVDESHQEITFDFKGASTSSPFITELRGYVSKTNYQAGEYNDTGGRNPNPSYNPTTRPMHEFVLQIQRVS